MDIVKDGMVIDPGIQNEIIAQGSAREAPLIGLKDASPQYTPCRKRDTEVPTS
jgi:hypothetical protein